MNLPPQQPMTPQRVLNLIGGTILGLAFFVFMLTFLGVNPAHADDLASCSFAPTCQDTTPDYVLIISNSDYRSFSLTTAHFEDEASCVTAGDAFIQRIRDSSSFTSNRVVTLCAAVEQSE